MVLNIRIYIGPVPEIHIRRLKSLYLMSKSQGHDILAFGRIQEEPRYASDLPRQDVWRLRQTGLCCSKLRGDAGWGAYS